MRVPITSELRVICTEIASQKKTDEEWAAIESDDTFQSENFVGGFDATEMAFCFSYFDETRSEYWFQLTRSEVADIAAGKKTTIEMRIAG